MDITFNERDEFNRQEIAKKILKLLNSDIEISPMVIDGDWGVGKTEFCYKLINYIKEHAKKSNEIIYIDAFKADHSDNPLITIISAILKTIPEGKGKKKFLQKVLPVVRHTTKACLKASVSHVLRQDFAEVVDDFDKDIQKTSETAIDALVELRLKDQTEAEKNLQALQKSLCDRAKETPLMIFVDELDRCRPNFAVDFLEVIKHTFNIENINFVLVTNKEQLKASINHCYGDKVDASRYLDKFIKFTFELPTTFNTSRYSSENVSLKHYKGLINKSNILEGKGLLEKYCIQIIEKISILNYLSLREIETLVRNMEIYTILADNDLLNFAKRPGLPTCTLMGIIIYSVSPDMAKSFLINKINIEDICNLFGVKDFEDIEKNKYLIQVICGDLYKRAYYKKELYNISKDNYLLIEKKLGDAFSMVLSYGYNEDCFDYCLDAIKVLNLDERKQ